MAMMSPVFLKQPEKVSKLFGKDLLSSGGSLANADHVRYTTYRVTMEPCSMPAFGLTGNI